MIRSLFDKFRKLRLKNAIPRGLAYARRQIIHRRERARDLNAATYHAESPGSELGRYFKLPDISLLSDFLPQIAETTVCFLEHRFDLLGSGWVQVRHGISCNGVESHRYNSGPQVVADSAGEWLAGRVSRRNLSESQRLWVLVDPGYVPIDWQLDFKCGYRWSERNWAQDVPFGHLPGVDIKVPWELARMQHLPQLAVAFACSQAREDGAFRNPDAYAREFRNVVLDFMATNPPRFGIHWRSAMDTGIRAANILVAYDLFRASGAVFDSAFESVLKRSMVEHGEHILRHFGWKHQPRGNHYLAHLAGLLFIAAYLPSSAHVDSWLALSIQELLSEVRRQFHADGSNFEGSTSYHRLSGEIVVYATALVAGLPSDKRDALIHYDPSLIKVLPKLNPPPFGLGSAVMSDVWPFPTWYARRIEKMAEFTIHITKPSGEIAQIGDNDSGRFLRLLPSYTRRSAEETKARYKNAIDIDNWPHGRSWWDENILDHRHLVSAVAGLIDREDFISFAGCSFEGAVVAGLAKGRVFKPMISENHSDADPLRFTGGATGIVEGGHQFELALSYPGVNLRERLSRFAYPDFGLYIFRSDRLFLSVRCGSMGQNGRGGHSHNDQLSIELEVDGKAVFADPGSFIYTPLPEMRNRYRSDYAHAGFVSPLMESARLDIGLFEIHKDPNGECLSFEGFSFVGRHTGFGVRVTRSIKIEAAAIRILDCVDQRQGRSMFIYPFYANLDKAANVRLSCGYGKMLDKYPFRITNQSNPGA